MTDPTPTPRDSRRSAWIAELRSLLLFLLAIFAFFCLVAQQFYIPSESMLPNLRVGDRLLASKYPYGWSFASVSYHLMPPRPGRVFGKLPARGDVVTLIPPDEERRGEDFIKRVIGLPGDTIRLVRGRLWLNGRPVETRDMGHRLIPIDGNLRCGAGKPARSGFRAAHAVTAAGKRYCRFHIFRETLPSGVAYDTIDQGRGAGDDFGPYRVPAGRVFVMGDNRDDSADSRVPIAYRGLGGAVPLAHIGGRAELVTFSLNGDATWNPLTWPSAFRSDRTATTLRPAGAP